MMSDQIRKPNLLLGLVGAAIGGCAGFFAFQWIYRQGYYALIIPPALLGLAAGYCARGRSIQLAIICGVAGLVLASFTEWNLFNIGSLAEFLAHIRSRSLTMVMLAIGTIASYRLALGMDEKRPSA